MTEGHAVVLGVLVIEPNAESVLRYEDVGERHPVVVCDRHTVGDGDRTLEGSVMRASRLPRSNVQIVWKKFMRYFDVEPRIVPLRPGNYRLTADRLEKYVMRYGSTVESPPRAPDPDLRPVRPVRLRMVLDWRYYR